MRDAERVENLRDPGQPGVTERKARIVDGLRSRLRGRIAVDRDQASVRTERSQDRACMPAASERAVDVDTVVAQCERGDRLFEQHGNVGAIGGVSHSGRQRLKPSSPGGSPPWNVIDCAICACHFTSSHSSSFNPCPTRTARFSRPA